MAKPLRVVTPEVKPKEDKRRRGFAEANDDGTTTDFSGALSGRLLGRDVVLAKRSYLPISLKSDSEFVNRRFQGIPLHVKTRKTYFTLSFTILLSSSVKS